VIRQAISCDICASEKQQTNHWFVATDQGGELRVAGWSSRNRLRPGSKHLCGQICLHKLVDLFISRTIAVRAPAGLMDDVAVQPVAFGTDAGLNSDTACTELESSVKVVVAPEPVTPKLLPLRAPAGLVAVPGRMQSTEPAPHDETPRYASSNWRAEAWDRERERELRAVERRPEADARRRAGS
jgi:hypothetical protein